VNVSVRRPARSLGTRCEIKNVNSFRFIMQAIEYEARRQVEILEDGGKITQETRLFDPGRGETRSMRSKEEAHDYRYFPDPDLLPWCWRRPGSRRSGARCPSCRPARRKRFAEQYGLTPYDAGVLTAEDERAAFFEQAAKGRNAKLVANWTVNDLLGRLSAEGRRSATARSAGGDRRAWWLIEDGPSRSRSPGRCSIACGPGREAPARSSSARAWSRSATPGALEAARDKLIAANPDKRRRSRPSLKPSAGSWAR
jgi:aspartyl-tRNA(Asn)/glutamyl-tRNA(Gln) amidotransferase subunit B